MGSFNNGNYGVFSIQTRDQMKDWLMKSLGWPLVQIEVTDDQLDICINDAIEEFTKYNIQDEGYLSYDLSQYGYDSNTEVETGFTLPSNVVSVFAIQESNMMGSNNQGINTLFSVQNTMWNAGSFPDFSRGGAGGWVNFEEAMQYIKMVKHLTGGGFKFYYNERDHGLKLIPNPKKMGGSANMGWICLGVNYIRADDMNYGESWCKRYAKARLKEILGEIRSKFNNVSLLGGGTLNTKILDEGLNEQEKLKTELWETYGVVCKFFVGAGG